MIVGARFWAINFTVDTQMGVKVVVSIAKVLTWVRVIYTFKEYIKNKTSEHLSSPAVLPGSVLDLLFFLSLFRGCT